MHSRPLRLLTATAVALAGPLAIAQDRPGFPSRATAVLVAESDGTIVRADAQTVLKPTARVWIPGTPIARLVARDPRATDPLSSLKAPAPTLALSQCLVDFSDYDALNWLTYAPPPALPYAEDTVAYTPWWFQACNGLDHAVVRPMFPYGHFHLGYEDPAIMPCHPGTLVDWGILRDDGTCEEFDPREEPRYVSGHDTFAKLHVYVYDGYQKVIFWLDSIRVLGDPIRLCYKPLQEDQGLWETSDPDGTTLPGIWLCWDELNTGNWDLSDYATHVTEVKIASTDQAGLPTIDDIVLRVYH